MAKRATRRTRGRPKASDARRLDARASLIYAAARVFAERGYSGATVAAIASAAGFSKGTFYWHFESKEDLFFVLIDERIDAPLREVAAMLETASENEDMALAANQRFLEVLTAEPETILLDHEYWALAARRPAMRRRYRQRLRELRRALAAALEARARTLGAPPFSTPPEETASAFLALLGGISRARLIDPQGTPDHLAAETFALIYAGLVARAGPRSS